MQATAAQLRRRTLGRQSVLRCMADGEQPRTSLERRLQRFTHSFGLQLNFSVRRTQTLTQIMTDIVVTDFPDVRQRARELGLPEVDALALLPDGLERPGLGPVVNNGEAATLRKLFAEAGLHVQVVSPVEHSTVAVRKSADLVLPVLFVGTSIWSQNPLAVQLAMDVISSYVTDALRGLRASGTAKL